VYGNSFIQTKVRYIHDNPVRAGVVRNPEVYKYSSAGVYSGQKGLIDIIPIMITIEKKADDWDNCKLSCVPSDIAFAQRGFLSQLCCVKHPYIHFS